MAMDAQAVELNQMKKMWQPADYNKNKKQKNPKRIIKMLSLRVELKTSRLLNGGSNQLSYESSLLLVFRSSKSLSFFRVYLLLLIV
jgi:hypothetical protein